MAEQGLAGGATRLLLRHCGRAKEGLGLAFRRWLGALWVHHWRSGFGLDRRGDSWGVRLEEAHAIILSLAYGRGDITMPNSANVFFFSV